MTTDVFCICDHALDGDGKISAIGIFDSFSSDIFPTVHSRFFVVSKIRLEEHEAGEHSIGFALRNPDNNFTKKLVEIVHYKEIPKGQTGSISTTLEIERFELHKPGIILLDLLVDSAILRTIPITILKSEK